jgi:hypothetical protein
MEFLCVENPRPAINSDSESFETAQQTHECVCWFESAQNEEHDGEEKNER